MLAFSFGLSLLAESNRQKLLTITRLLFHAAGALIFWCLMLLFSAFFLNDFSIRYIVEHSSVSTPWYYRLSALWAGPEGTLLLWVFMIYTGVVMVAFQIHRNDFLLHRRVVLIASLISLSLLSMLLYSSNPFQMKLIDVNDGLGLNLMLIDWAMIVHPPLLFAGYTAMGVAFILAMCKQDDPMVAGLLARWARLACVFLTAGIVTGAIWAYDELGWGGYWGWDPVENASLLPWFFAFALLHFSPRRAETISRPAVLLAGLGFAGTILATWLTRSGIVFSLHAFADNVSSNYFLLGILIVIFATIVQTAKMPRSVHPKVQPISLMMWWLMLMMIAVLVGTLWPVWAKGWIEHPEPLSPSFYNNTIGLMGLGLMITLGYNSYSQIRLGRRIEVLLISATIASVICFSIWFLISKIDATKLVGMFILIVDAILILFAILNRRKQILNLNQLPMTVAHLGVVVLGLGLLASMVQQPARPVVLERKQSENFGAVQVRLESLAADEKKDGTVDVQADLNIVSPYRHEILHPSQTLLPDGSHRIKPDFSLGFFSDIYAVLEGFSGTQAMVTVRRNWLVSWVWFGSGLILLACLMTAVTRRRTQ
jgi:cytochrome c-type biogenesis protein CcmF